MASKGSADKQKEWLALQKKIFTRWVNQKLQARNTSIKDVVTDIGDGVALIALMEILSEKSFSGKIVQKASSRVQKIDNSNRALDFVKACGISMKVFPSAEDIVDGNEKNVLGLIWSIILRYMKIGDEEEGQEQLNARDALLRWVRNKTEGYAGVDVQNFASSFHDGLALCAIIHKHRPNMINFGSLSKENGRKNLETAFDAAEKYFGLEKYITVDELLKMDEISMIVYVGDYYYGIASQRKLDLAARRIGKVIKITKEHDKMRADYVARVSELQQKIRKVQAMLGDRTVDNTYAGAKRRLEEFYQYSQNEKSELIKEHLGAESLYNTLSLKLAHHHRPEYVPPAGSSLKDLEATFAELERSEQERNIALHAELSRQVRLIKLAAQHKSKYEKLVAWHDEKEAYLLTKENITSVNTAQLYLKLHEAYEGENRSVTANGVASLVKLGKELADEKYEHINDIRERETDIDNKWESLREFASKKRLVLEDDLARETFREKLQLKFDQHTGIYEQINSWVQEKLAYLGLVEEIDSVSGAQLQIALLESFHREKDTVYATTVAQLKALGAEIEAAKYETELSSYTFAPEPLHERVETIDGWWATLAAHAQEKSTRLQADLAREIRREELRLEFAQLALEFNTFFKDIVDRTSETLFGDTLDEVQAFASVLDKDDEEIQATADAKLASLQTTHKNLHDIGVTFNVYTTTSIGDLQTTRQQLSDTLTTRRQRYQKELDLQIANDKLAQEFAGLVKNFVSWISHNKDEIARNKADLEGQLANIDERIANVSSDAKRLDEIEASSKKLEAAGILSNKHTNLTFKDVKVQWEQYQSLLHQKRSMIQEEIEVNKLQGISAEQMAEIKKTFGDYHKGTGKLDRANLKACLYALGEELTPSQIKETLSAFGDGTSITEEGFVRFLVQRYGDSDTKEEIVTSFELISKGDHVATVARLETVVPKDDLDYITSTAPKKAEGYDYVAWTEDVYSR